jgi:ubiquinone/menaquinone biosynthesis C-methylase UbiE/DNA-binding transcriptional ArsR family regulator
MMRHTLNKASERASEHSTEHEQLHVLAGFCKASADQLRLQVLRVLRNESFGVSELCSLFDIRQPAMSHHLKVLAGASLVATRREGNSIFYRRGTPAGQRHIRNLHHHLLETVDQIALPPEVKERVGALYEQRKESSRSFFRGNAHKFREQQDLIASYDQYAETVGQLLQEALPRKRRIALEIGPGDGSFLGELSPRFEHVIALDNAAEMLAKAEKLALENDLSNIAFIHGDTTSDALEGLQADCVVINMVLHHIPSPADIFQDVASHLAPGGIVIVTDLCSHDQAWARENCGDLWLGFEPEDLSRWAKQATLTDVSSVYLAQRNGFQIQVRLFGHAYQ